nr:MAG TPA: hypothetical protein [Caudoviricetes sp.]
MSDTYYRDREIKFVLLDCVSTGSEYDKVIYSRVEIHIGDNNETPPVAVGDTLQEVIKQFDKWCANHHIGSEVRNND